MSIGGRNACHTYLFDVHIIHLIDNSINHQSYEEVIYNHRNVYVPRMYGTS